MHSIEELGLDETDWLQMTEGEKQKFLDEKIISLMEEHGVWYAKVIEE